MGTPTFFFIYYSIMVCPKRLSIVSVLSSRTLQQFIFCKLSSAFCNKLQILLKLSSTSFFILEIFKKNYLLQLTSIFARMTPKRLCISSADAKISRRNSFNSIIISEGIIFNSFRFTLKKFYYSESHT